MLRKIPNMMVSWTRSRENLLAKGFPLGLSSGFIGSVTVLVSVGDRLRQVVDH